MSRLAPIVGPKPLAVKDRPKCKYCDRPLRPHMHNDWQGQLGSRPVTRTFDGHYGIEELFCTNRCAERFGLVFARHGYTLKKPVSKSA